MKKAMGLLFILGLLCGGAQAGQKFTAALYGHLILPGDTGYTDVYGKSGFLPEIKAGVSLSGSFFLWARYGFFGQKGETPALKLEAESSQHVFSLGAGYRGKLGSKLGYEIEAGAVLVRYKEEAMGLSSSGSAFGFRAGAGLTYALAGPVFAAAEAGYLYASDKVEDITIKPGGVLLGLGLGVKF